MYACIFAPGIVSTDYPKLLDFASQFSPLLEETSPDSIIVDLKDSALLNGPASQFPLKAEKLAAQTGLKIRVAVAGNPDAAFHAARGFETPSYVQPGKEKEFVSGLPLRIIRHELASVPGDRFEEIISTLRSWGIHTFGQLAGLPAPGLSERFGPEGLRLRQLATGRSSRSLIVQKPGRTFCRSENFENPVVLKEPLLLVLSRMLKEMNEDLGVHSLAASGMELQMMLVSGPPYHRKIEFPTPVKELKTLEKLVDLELSISPPKAAVAEVKLRIEQGLYRGVQAGLFVPCGPEPEKTEVVLARITKMLGTGKAGSPRMKDSHHPDSFRIERFDPGARENRGKSDPRLPDPQNRPVLRALRPPLKASIWNECNRPVRLHAPDSGIRRGISGKIVSAAGPWISSGEWWSGDKWEREEWDLQLSDGTVCRAYLDLLRNTWFVDGIYD